MDRESSLAGICQPSSNDRDNRDRMCAAKRNYHLIALVGSFLGIILGVFLRDLFDPTVRHWDFMNPNVDVTDRMETLPLP